MIRTETDAALYGKQWLLSSFGPFKESKSLEFFIEDKSFEEVRLEYYEAKRSNNLQQYIQMFNSLYNDAMNKMTQLKMLAPETLQVLVNAYNAIGGGSENPQSPLAVPTTNVFSMSNTNSSIFGGAQQQVQPQPAASIFGGASTNNPFQKSAFGASIAQTSPFMQQSPSSVTSIFGGSQPVQAQNTFFGASTPASIFGGVQSSMTLGNSSSMQLTPQQPATSSVFSSSIFSQPPQHSQPPVENIFGIGQQNPAIAQQPNPFQQTSVFAQPAPADMSMSVAQQPIANVFGISQQQPPAVVQQQNQSGSIFQIQQGPAVPTPSFGGNPFQQSQPIIIDESVYSRPEELTAEQIQAFQCDAFVLGQIPIKPPPKQLCGLT